MQARVTRPRRAAGWRPARSLSGRLIAGLVALLALGCATVGVVTYFAIQRALFNELDNQLQAATASRTPAWTTGWTVTATAATTAAAIAPDSPPRAPALVPS